MHIIMWGSQRDAVEWGREGRRLWECRVGERVGPSGVHMEMAPGPHAGDLRVRGKPIFICIWEA